MTIINDNKMILNECLEALGLVLEYDLYDHMNHQHAIRVGEGCVLMGEKLGFNQEKIQLLYYAGLIHDVGKISIDLEILRKKGKLSTEEFEEVKKHSVYGSRIIASIPELSDLAMWVRWHHERWDGTGYPDGLKGDEIPIEIQVLSAVDCFDSLQTPRMDRPPLSPDDAYNIIEGYRGSYFNPQIVDLLFEMHREKTLVPGKSSEKFIGLKKKYVDIPLIGDGKGYREGYGISGLYPILRLFARVIDAKHKYTGGHSTRVSILSRYLAETMGFPRGDVIKLEIAGLLHDAGKVSIPNEILDKPSAPTSEEWQIIKNHPVHSANILSKIGSLDDIAEIALYHHKYADNGGYPETEKDCYINYLARVIAVADAYDAITSKRAYSDAQSPDIAYAIIREGLGTQFDSKVGQVLLDTPSKWIQALYDMHHSEVMWTLRDV